MDQDLIDAGWTLDPDDGFVGHVGGLWRREVGEETQVAFVARDFHANRNGVVHGGMLMTFIDRAMGQRARKVTGAPRGATVSLTHQFLAPVHIGDLVEMTPQVVRKTSKMVFLSGIAHVGGEPVVSAQGVWRVTFTTP
jgi:acyl-coenzyme A thioesterase PaaI-like protein